MSIWNPAMSPVSAIASVPCSPSAGGIGPASPPAAPHPKQKMDERARRASAKNLPVIVIDRLLLFIGDLAAKDTGRTIARAHPRRRPEARVQQHGKSRASNR